MLFESLEHRNGAFLGRIEDDETLSLVESARGVGLVYAETDGFESIARLIQQLAEQNVSLMRPLLQVETEHLTIFEPQESGFRHIEHIRPEEGWAVMREPFYPGQPRPDRPKTRPPPVPDALPLRDTLSRFRRVGEPGCRRGLGVGYCRP